MQGTVLDGVASALDRRLVWPAGEGGSGTLSR